MSIGVQRVGHVVLKVRDLARSVAFYRDVLGLAEVARLTERWGTMVFFSACGDNHHDLALLDVGPGAPQPDRRAAGLYHVAFKIAGGLDELRRVKAHLDARGVPIAGVADHRVSQSIYLDDPDGNGVELYVDADRSVWRADPAAVATIAPLAL